jgi:replicative superfamily II helicase
VLIAEAMPADKIASVLDRRMDLLASLQALPGGFEPALPQTVLRGATFHHAGLTSEGREMVAEAYDQGTLRVMVATCSLAAGINLPARRVVLSGGRMGCELVVPAMLRQMRGRAE